MNPFALYLASGESLYLGTAMLIIVVLLSPRVYKKWTTRLRNFFAWIGLALILLACAPFPWPWYAAFFGMYLLWFLMCNITAQASRSRLRKMQIISTILLALSALILMLVELPHRIMRTVEGQITSLVVIGDSISSGIDAGYEPWPAIFQQDTGIPVKNLSRPGIGVEEAMPLTKGVADSDRWVLLEIGGNDLLSTLSASQFDAALDRLLSRLIAEKRRILMFELPLLPHKIEYGSVQRKLAAKYHVELIPKRYFIDVLSGADATSDGLHLSPVGVHRMAVLVQKFLRNALPSRVGVPATSPR